MGKEISIIAAIFFAAVIVIGVVAIILQGGLGSYNDRPTIVATN